MLWVIFLLVLCNFFSKTHAMAAIINAQIEHISMVSLQPYNLTEWLKKTSPIAPPNVPIISVIPANNGNRCLGKY